MGHDQDAYPRIGRRVVTTRSTSKIDVQQKLPASRLAEVPRLISNLGSKAEKRFTTFFTDNIRNRNTREAYFRAAFQFFQWCDEHRLTVENVESFHVSAYIESLSREKSKPTVKQHLAAIRMLYDWLVVGQVIPTNPAHAVRGPKHVATQGLTPILDADQMKQLLDSIDTTNIIGLRDRALIGVMTATFGRIEATLKMNLSDYFPEGKSWSIRLHEKNSKVITMPVQHKLEEYLDAYIEAAGGPEVFPFETNHEGKKTKNQPLFLSTRGRSRTLTANRMSRQDAWRMVKRRAAAAGVYGAICNHSFRGTGITDRRDQQLTRGEVEKITILG